MLFLFTQKIVDIYYNHRNYQVLNDKGKINTNKQKLTLRTEQLLFISNSFQTLKDILHTDSKRDDNMLKVISL